MSLAGTFSFPYHHFSHLVKSSLKIESNFYFLQDALVPEMQIRKSWQEVAG